MPPASKVVEGFARIHSQVEPAAPLLVYLRTSDVAGAALKMLAERGEPWTPWYLATMSDTGWARQRELRGVGAVVGFSEAWEELAAELYAMHAGPKLRLTDPQRDWEAAMRKIFEALGVDSAPERSGAAPTQTG